MSSAMERDCRLLILIVAVSSLGCQETRFLSCRVREPSVETRSYDLHDPFPDEDIGPKTFTRPRTFQVPRSDTRKSFDLRNLQASKGVTPPQMLWDPTGVNPTAAVPVQPIWRQPARGVPIATQPGMWDESSPRYNVVRN